jgi:AbiV family abortive infection protein
MPKPKGNKNFMTLSQKECLTASTHLLENAEGLYNDAQLLAKNKSYGRATSMLIHSTEETMKAFILFLDGNGFQFRKNTNGINNLFVNHSLRYGLAMVLSVLHIFSEDLKYFLQRVRNEPNKLMSLSKDKAALESKFLEYFKEKIKIVLLEVIWFSKAEFLRQEGFYVDYVDKIKTPLEIDENEYNEVLVRINGMRSFVLSLIESFESDDEEFNKHLEKLKKQFLKEGWYQKIGGLIEMFRDRKTNPLENLSVAINEFSNEIQSKKSFNE